MQKEPERLTSGQNLVLAIVVSMLSVSAIVCFGSFVWRNLPDRSPHPVLSQPTPIRYRTLPPEWTRTPQPADALPVYLVNYQRIQRHIADLLLVVDKSFTQSDAQKIADYFEWFYSDKTTLEVIFFCDTQYANAAFLDSTDLEISMPHVLYDYGRWGDGERGIWRAWKRQGQACR